MDKLSEIGKRTDWDETLGGFLKLDVARNSCWRDYGERRFALSSRTVLQGGRRLYSLTFALSATTTSALLTSLISSVLPFHAYLKLLLKALSLQ